MEKRIEGSCGLCMWLWLELIHRLGFGAHLSCPSLSRSLSMKHILALERQYCMTVNVVSDFF